MLRNERLREMDEKAKKFSSSIEHDLHIFYYDILVDIAHVLNLLKSNYLSKKEALEIIEALNTIAKTGYKKWDFEDIHEAIEAEITKVTEAGKKIQTGRSRNDEVATCLRMFARDHLLEIAEKIVALQSTILEIAEKNDLIMPGFTHLQFAQPTRVSHHLVMFHDLFERDFERVLEAYRRVNKCPLGASAFAGTSYNLDREFVAKILGFDGLLENSEDAVASRDFLIESIYVCTSIMLNVSRIAEEIVIFAALGLIELPDEFASTSSIMPQKKNPDIAELLRAKTGKLIGNLTSAATIYKATPFSYNRDFQEMNSILYESMKVTIESLEVFLRMLSKLKFNAELMRKKSVEGFAVATELADMLVRDFGIPFRVAHRIVGRIASKNATPSAQEIESIAKEFGYEIRIPEERFNEAMDVEKAVERRQTIGGTRGSEVKRMLDFRKEKLNGKRRKIKKMRRKIEIALEFMGKEVKKIGADFYAYWKKD
ncbi:MAG: argininosuccinate lyase [Archaeoglobaceae archaeon]